MSIRTRRITAWIALVCLVLLSGHHHLPGEHCHDSGHSIAAERSLCDTDSCDEITADGSLSLTHLCECIICEALSLLRVAPTAPTVPSPHPGSVATISDTVESIHEEFIVRPHDPRGPPSLQSHSIAA